MNSNSLTRPDQNQLDSLLKCSVKHGVAKSTRGLRSYLDHLFRGSRIADRRVLDIGGGTGFVGLYCLAQGARALTTIEPEAAGSTEGASQVLVSMANELNLADRLTVMPTTFQAFESAPVSFDLLVLHNSINHLDEQACIDLRSSNEARKRYEELLTKLYVLTAPGGDVIITDASRKNVAGLLNVRSPFAPSVQWHLHQTPSTWSQLLKSAGFQNMKVRWSSFGRLGRIGRWLLANRVAAYFLHSQFILHGTKPGASE